MERTRGRTGTVKRTRARTRDRTRDRTREEG